MEFRKYLVYGSVAIFAVAAFQFFLMQLIVWNAPEEINTFRANLEEKQAVLNKIGGNFRSVFEYEKYEFTMEDTSEFTFEMEGLRGKYLVEGLLVRDEANDWQMIVRDENITLK